MNFFRFDRFRTRISTFVILLLLIEFLDELVFGVREAAWPLIRDDLDLSYIQIGILLSLPSLISNLIEPFLGILGDIWRRRALILGGGVLFGLSLIVTAVSQYYLVLLISFMLFYPASGSFVSLSQAALMDYAPSRHEQNMARWTFAGSLGVVLGPLCLGWATTVEIDWRVLFFGLGILAFLLVMVVSRYAISSYAFEAGGSQVGKFGFFSGMRSALQALRRVDVIRWLSLLEFSDLMLDVLLGFLALYFVDIVGATITQASLAVAIWSGMGLIGDFLLIPLLERVSGLVYLRISALIELFLFPMFLMVDEIYLKLVLVGLLGFFNAGWYAILRAKLYSSMPGQSGVSVALSNLFGFVGSFIPIGLAWIAQRYNLNITMWLLWLGPLALILGIPSPRRLEKEIV